MKLSTMKKVFGVISVLNATLILGQPLPGPQQGNESLQGVELKGKAPVNPQTLRVRLPRPQETALGNGMQIALLEDHKLPTFAVQWIIEGGGLADPAGKHGLAMAAASLLREGTTTRSSRDVAEQLATLGASLSASASPASTETAVTVTGLIEHIDATLQIAADVIRRPTFPAVEIEKFRTRLLAQLQYQRSLPAFIAQEQFMRTIYGTHPGAFVVPPEEVIKALGTDELAQYHAANYRPNKVVVVAHGDITLKDLAARLERTFGDWQKVEVKQRALPELTAPAKPRVLLVDRPGSVQTSLWLGSLGIERNSEDYFPVLVMNHVLGGGAASRLFLNLRENKGYTYGVYSSFTGSTFPGVIVASTDVRSEVTEGALKELTSELRRLIDEPVPAQELANAKRALIGRFALSLDSPQTLMTSVATVKTYGLAADYWDTYPQRVEDITPADIQRVAKKYLDASKLQIVAVGDAAAVRKVLAAYGEVESP